MRVSEAGIRPHALNEMKNHCPQAFIKSLGCISNLLDGTGYEQLVVEAGYSLTKKINNADLILINTCAFNRIKEDEAVQFIRHAGRRMQENARILVCGCLPKINQERLRTIHAGITFGPRDPSALLDLLRLNAMHQVQSSGPISYTQYSLLKKTIYQTRRLMEIIPGINKLPLYRRLFAPFFIYAKDVYCLKVVSGCYGSCTYCAIRFAKGRGLSKLPAEIEKEFSAALARGYCRFVLVGDEITAYGRDLTNGETILDVIRLLCRHPDVESVFLESFEPSFMISFFDEIQYVLGEGNIPVFCSSVQSGSNRILRLMKRDYKVEDFIECMDGIKRSSPAISLRTELIVGFPDESETDFADSLQLVTKLNLDFVRAHIYEDRPHTPASRMSNKIPERIKCNRRRRIVRQHWKNLMFSGIRRR